MAHHENVEFLSSPRQSSRNQQCCSGRCEKLAQMSVGLILVLECSVNITSISKSKKQMNEKSHTLILKTLGYSLGYMYVVIWSLFNDVKFMAFGNMLSVGYTIWLHCEIFSFY